MLKTTTATTTTTTTTTMVCFIVSCGILYHFTVDNPVLDRKFPPIFQDGRLGGGLKSSPAVQFCE